MTEITQLLERWGEGDREAFRALMPLVYDELRKLADFHLHHERHNHTLQPTALVHEAYIRLNGVREIRFESRAHFYGAAAHAMRRVLVDHARQRSAIKRGGPDRQVVTLASIDVATDVSLDVDLVALDEALERLAGFAPERARVVELRYFGGLSVDETAAFLNVSPATVKRRWTFARAWLLRALGPPETADQARRLR